MYYSGLFESPGAYSGLPTRPFKTDRLNESSESPAELSCLVDASKTMVSPVATSGLVSSGLSLSGAFGGAHFASPHYRSAAAASAVDLMSSSVYGSTSHLSPCETLGSNLLHDQSAFLEAAASSTTYGIGPLSPYSHYPQYLTNPVMAAPLKAVPPTNGSYGGHNSFYAANAPPYHSLYSESFISDYIARNHIDDSQSVYKSSVDNNSFVEHLKRLQESFQSKSPKVADNCSTSQSSLSSVQVTNGVSPAPMYTTSHNRPVRPEPVSMQPLCSNGSNSPIVYSDHYGKDTSPLLTSLNPVASTVTVSRSSPKDNTKDSTSGQSRKLQTMGRSKSPSSTRVHSDSVQSVTLNSCSIKRSSSNEQPSNCPSTSHLGSSIQTKVATCSTTENKLQNNDSKNINLQERPVKMFEEAKPYNLVLSVSKQKIKSKSKPKTQLIKKKSRLDDQVNHKKKGGKHQPVDKCENIKTEDLYEEKLKPSKNENDKLTKAKKNRSNVVQENKTKKTNGAARRRRFRSGLDMIRSSRKKPSIKVKSTRSIKSVTVKDKKKVITMKDLRFESKRLMVNKSLGETLLHRSARNNRLDVVKFCLESDACDVNARDNAGYTALHECSSRGNLEVARLLLQHSADVNASATGGIRPLHDAIENNHIELVRLLLSYGAEPNISTYSGSTPLQLCRSKAMFKFLKGFYSDISTERPVIDSTTLSWKFRNELSEKGFDVFAEVTSEEEQCNTLYFSENPIVPLYNLLHSPGSPFYFLGDILEATGLTFGEFTYKHPDAKVSKISKSDLARAVLSQLEQRTSRSNSQPEQEETSIIYQSRIIDDILHISTVNL